MFTILYIYKKKLKLGFIRFFFTYDDIKKAAEYAFFSIEEAPIIDQGRTVGYIYVFTK